MIAQALLVTLAAIIGNSEPGIGVPMVQRPIVMGPLVGLLLGDLQTGLAVGTLLELAFLGTQSIGAALPPDLTTGGILATAFAISTGATPEAAVALALPIASLALLVKNVFYLFVRTALLHRGDTYAAAGDCAGVARMHLLSFFGYVIMMSVLTGVCFYVGSPAVEAFLAVVPDFVMSGLTAAAGILPALGFALLAEMLFSKEVAPYFFLGFLLVAYLQIPVLGIALFGVVLVALLLINDNAKAANVQEVSEDEDF